MDAIVVKVRDHGRVFNKAIHLVLALNLKGEKELSHLPFVRGARER
jgi:transposase-like protein